MVRPVAHRLPSPVRRALHRLVAGLASVASAGALAAVDANTASAESLEALSGIGPSIAKRIVDERRKGPYRSLDDLQARVRGIGEAKARRLAAAGLTVGPGLAAAPSAASGTSARPPSAPATAADAAREPVRVIVGGQGGPRP